MIAAGRSTITGHSLYLPYQGSGFGSFTKHLIIFLLVEYDIRNQRPYESQIRRHGLGLAHLTAPGVRPWMSAARARRTPFDSYCLPALQRPTAVFAPPHTHHACAHCWTPSTALTNACWVRAHRPNMLFLISQITSLGFASMSQSCGCTGNQDKAEQQSYYPTVMGDSCHAWDAGMDYCQPGGSSVNATTGAAQSWCYDPVRASISSLRGCEAPPEQDRLITRLLPGPAGSGATSPRTARVPRLEATLTPKLALSCSTPTLGAVPTTRTPAPRPIPWPPTDSKPGGARASC